MAKADDPKAQNLPKGAKRITVACKYPHGLILRLFRHDKVDVPSPGGLRTETVPVQIGEQVRINGPVAPTNQSSRHEIAGGFALTHGVDADFFAEWMKQNAASDMVKNGLIFSASDRNSARDRAEDHVKTRTGVEPLDMSTTKNEKGREIVNDVRVTREVGHRIQTSDARNDAA